jgi:hypothetical protein
VNSAEHLPPRQCPVCGDELHLTRLGCGSCGSELSGRFASCPYCALREQDRQILRTFLVSRGNMRELARDLRVSYPTARQRFADLLARLGLEDAADESEGRNSVSREEVLRQLAAGELDLDEATAMLDLPGPGMSVAAGTLAMDGPRQVAREDMV